MPDTSPRHDLTELRRRIDAIDAELHAALKRRASVVEAVTEAKRGREGGAFRPDREADMMRALVARHDGALPLFTIEHVWREIISTFTQLQSPYRLHLAPGDETEALKLADMARFYFGFATPVVAESTAEAVVEAVSDSKNDLGLVLLDPPAATPWWAGLGDRAVAMARLPFLALPGREAGTPALVISRPVPDCRPFDRTVLVLDEAPSRLPAGAERLGTADDSTLISVAAADVGAFPGARAAGGYFDPIDFGAL